MEELLPLIIALVITFIASMGNKKKKRGTTESPWDETSWEEMVGDAWKQAKTVQEQKPETQIKPVHETIRKNISQKEPEQKIESLETTSKVNRKAILRDMTPPVSSEPEAITPKQISKTVEITSKDESTQIEDNTGNDNKSIFNGDFDARMAIIYSEIMKPKFKEF